MDRKIILDEIIQLTETLNEQTEALKQFSGPVPQIEVDIILSNIRVLYEKYKELSRNEKQLSSPEHTEKIPLPYEKPIVTVKEKPDAPKITEQTVSEKEILEFEKNMIVESMTQFSMLAETPTKESIVPEVPQKKMKPQKKSDPDLFTSDAILIDKFKDEKKSLNDMLSDSAGTKNLAAKLQKNPIKDLKTAIGINEKFMFINELFEGSLQKYNEHINMLNSQTGKAEAMKLMETLSGEFSWKKESDAFLTFAELINRRYL